MSNTSPLDCRTPGRCDVPYTFASEAKNILAPVQSTVAENSSDNQIDGYLSHPPGLALGDRDKTGFQINVWPPEIEDFPAPHTRVDDLTP